MAVTIDRKFNQEMPVGSVVKDVEFENVGPYHVTSPAHTTPFGTEIGLVDDSGQRFKDLAKFYEFVI